MTDYEPSGITHEDQPQPPAAEGRNKTHSVSVGFTRGSLIPAIVEERQAELSPKEPDPLFPRRGKAKPHVIIDRDNRTTLIPEDTIKPNE